MKDTNQLREISEALGLQDITDKLRFIQERQQQADKELIIPLVGEYSSGKTSLLNALTNGKKLETAIVPTTATIFEVRFSNMIEKAEVFYEDNTMREVEDISTLKNKDLANAQLVRVYDSSVKIPLSTVLVDTPGLSSLDPKHQKALVGYLPLADVILMVVDVNQGVTASVLKFIDIVGLAKKRIYITITMCDTKPESEREKVKQYIRENTKVPIAKIVCVSARNGEVHELTSLISEIQKDKNQIVAEITEQRLDAMRKELLNYVVELLNSSKLSTKELDKKIISTKRDVQETQSKIDRLISELERKISILSVDTAGDFSQKISAELDAIAKNPPKGNVNQITIALIESISHLYFENFKSDVIKELSKLVKERKNSMEGINLPSLAALDLSDYTLSPLSYNIDLELPELQKLNKKIANGIKTSAKVVVQLGKVAIKVLSNGEDGGDSSTDIDSMEDDSMTDLADSVTDVATMASSKVGLEKVVGFFTERTLAKPQRARLINDYMFTSLLPEFKEKLELIGNSTASSIGNMLYSESEDKMNQLKEGLEKLHSEKELEKESYAQKINLLETYKKSLEL
ncbi:hypothetical protein FACS1894199_08820 [Bacteroidia bacterium]|nr:hypothetical protein FACS1894199_08820 [Bacteroidia bacterium]